MHKSLALFLLLSTFYIPSIAQDKPLSPQETVSGKIGDATIEIVYCRPSARDRKVMGELVAYGEVWRTGANAATTFSTDKDIMVEGKKLPAGKYELFTIPGESEWTIIFQTYSRQWGAYSYKQENDVLRVKVKPTKAPAFVETFTIKLEKQKVNLAWENTSVAFGIK